MSTPQFERSPWTIPIGDGPIAPWQDRILAVAVAVAASVCFGALARLRPDVRGHGTHEQLGMDACSWPIAYGIPCPTCGCTTAACLLVHGRIIDAFVTQPFGAAFAAFGTLVGVQAVWCLVRGRSFADVLVRWPFWRTVGGGFLLLLLAWGYTWLTWRR